MTDPTPLLPPHRRRSLDDTIEHFIGDFGRTQLLQSAVSSFAWFFDAQQTFIAVFTDAVPQQRINCQDPNHHSITHTSIISEWSLQCSGSVITGLPSSSFFLGCLSGGFLLPTLADSSLGRKNLLVFSLLLMSLTGVLTALSTNIWMYTALRFLSGLGRTTIGTCALVLATELVGKKWRSNVGILGFIWFSFGFLSLPLIAFLLKDYSWRLIYLTTCVPCIIYSVLVYFFVHESPRWLFLKGRKQEFIQTLRTISENPSYVLTDSFFENFVECENSEEYMQDNNIYSALKILLKKRWAFQRLAVAMVVGFGLGTIYYGMPLGLGNLSFNLYLSVTLNALSELPASLATFFLIGKLKRNGSVLGLALLSGICSVGCAVFSRNVGVQIGLELVCFFSACTAVDVVLIYTLELFPTCVRNSAVAMVRQAIMFSGVVSPVVVAAGRKSGWLSYGVFGATIGMCGLVVLWLPETRARRLCDTMEEEEEEEEMLRNRHEFRISSVSVIV